MEKTCLDCKKSYEGTPYGEPFCGLCQIERRKIRSAQQAREAGKQWQRRRRRQRP